MHNNAELEPGHGSLTESRLIIIFRLNYYRYMVSVSYPQFHPILGFWYQYAHLWQCRLQ